MIVYFTIAEELRVGRRHLSRAKQKILLASKFINSCFSFNLFISSVHSLLHIAEVVFAFPTSRKSRAIEVELDASLLRRAFLIGGLL